MGSSEIRPGSVGSPVVHRPSSDEELAFLTVAELSALDPLAPGELHRADEALSRPAQAVRSSAEVRGHAHRGPGDAAGRAGRRGDRRGQDSRAAPRHSLGSQGPDRLSRLSHHLGRPAVQGASPQREGHGRRPARRGRRRARGQAYPGGAGPGRQLVRRQDAKPVGPAEGIERLLGRLGGRRRRGARRLRAGQ